MEDIDDIQQIDMSTLLTPAELAHNEHLVLFCDLGDPKYTDEEREKLDKAMDQVVAGWVAKQMREKQRRKPR